MPKSTICSIDECEKPALTRGWCCGHYKRWHRTGDPLPKPRTARLCDFPGCDKVHAGLGLCAGHYAQSRKGQSLAPLDICHSGQVSTEDRFWLKVEKSDGCWGWTASVDNGYARLGAKGGGKVWAHRLSWEIHNGPIPKGMYVDHLCHTKTCTNPAHLRLTTPKQNNEHRKGPTAVNTSGFLGVSYHKQRRKWVANVTHNRQGYYVGIFETPQLAEAAVIAKRNELFTHNERDRT